MKKRGLGLSAKGLWLGGKNGQRVQAEATGCGCREVRGSTDAQEIPVLEGRVPAVSYTHLTLPTSLRV